MIRFNSIKWLPKTPIIALAVLALAALAGGGVHRAEAQTPTPQQYTVELSFDTITFPVINDCEFILHGCSNADVYGTINGRTTSTGVGAQGARNLGTWENKANCNSTVAYGWASFGSGELPCAKFVEQGKTYNFADAPLCTSYTHLLCTGPYQRNNNKIRLTVKPGEQIRAGINLKDTDVFTAHDDVCNTTKWVGPFSETELASLNRSYGTGVAYNGDASCAVTFTVKRV